MRWRDPAHLGSGGATRPARPPRSRPALFTLVVLMVAAATVGAAAARELVIESGRQLALADRYLELGQYEKAIAEYERFLHFFPSDPFRSAALFRSAEAHSHLNRFDPALRLLGRVIALPETEPRRVRQAHLLTSRCLEALEGSGPAVAYLRRLADAQSDADFIAQIHYRIGWILIDDRQWDEAHRALARFPADHPAKGHIEALNEALDRHTDIARKDPLTAGLLATIPGAGHLYCGQPRQAMVALGVNGALGLAAWEAFDSGQDVLGALLAIATAGFYSGNIYGAVNSAHKANRQSTHRFIRDLKDRFRVDLMAGRRGIGLRLTVAFH